VITVIRRERDREHRVRGLPKKPARDIVYATHGRGALVLVVSASFGFLADRPFRSQVALEDDVRVTDDAVAGEFAFPLDDFINLEAGGTNTYYLLMSIGPYLSTVEVTEA